MGVGEIAGLIAAIAFAILAGFLIYPLTVKQVNKSLEDVNKISSAASTTANNVGALTDLYGSFLGKPVIKVASTVYALKSTAQSFMSKRVMQQPNKGE